MADQQLSTTEIEELLSVFTGGRKGSGGLTDVESLDLDRVNRIPRGIFETLEVRHEQAVRTLRQQLRMALGVDLEMALRDLQQERFQTFRDRQEEPCCGFVYDMKPLRQPSYLVMDFPFAFACIDRLLGGRGRPEGHGRELTTTEVAVLADLLDPILAAHVKVWERYMRLTPSLQRTISVPRFMREVGFDDVVLVADYRFKGFVDGHGFRFAMPLPGLEGLLQYRRHETEEQKADAAGSREELQQQMAGVELDVAVRLGGAMVPVREILDLEVGDVVVLDRRVGATADLMVEGRPKFSGRLLRRGHDLLFCVAGSTPDWPKNALPG